MTFNELMIAVAGLLAGAAMVALWGAKSAPRPSRRMHAPADWTRAFSKARPGDSESADLALATMRERMSNLQAEASRVTAELNNLEESHRAQQSDLSTLRHERAQLQVHADRVVPLEPKSPPGRSRC
jgi:uncharacterized small protein (DUF1192 family)